VLKHVCDRLRLPPHRFLTHPRALTDCLNCGEPAAALKNLSHLHHLTPVRRCGHRSLSSCEGSCCTATVEHPLRHRCAVAPARTHSPEPATLWRTTWPPPPPTPHLSHVLPVPAALILTTSSLLTRLCVSCSCRSTFGHHLLGVPDRILPRIGSPPIARGCASPRRPGYFPPLSAAHHDVVGPRAGFATPLAPTGTLLVASMATVNYHLDLAPLGVRHALSNPRIHVFRACVSVPPPTLPWPIRRPAAHITRAAASLTVSLQLPYPWQVCRRRERRRRGRWRARQSPEEPSALAAEHGRGRQICLLPVARQPRWLLSGAGGPWAVWI
jgi:hypothetical protein